MAGMAARTSHQRPNSCYRLLPQSRKAAAENTTKARAFSLYAHVHHYKPQKQDEAGPPVMPAEIFTVIMGLVSKMSLADMLEEQQRFIHVDNVTELRKNPIALLPWRTSLSLRRGLPSFGPADTGYRFTKSPFSNNFLDGVLSVTFHQQVKPLPPLDTVSWTFHIDTKQVCISENAKEVLIPSSAVTVETDIAKHAGHLYLTDAQVEAFNACKPTVTICDLGRKMRFEAPSTGREPALGFDLYVKSNYNPKRVVQAHAGFAVGDRVVVNSAYGRYAHFAIGHGAIIRKIQIFTFALFFVEFEDEDIVRQVRWTHKKKNYLMDGQDPALVPCQRFHFEAAAFAADDVTFARMREYLHDKQAGPAKKRKA